MFSFAGSLHFLVLLLCIEKITGAIIITSRRVDGEEEGGEGF